MWARTHARERGSPNYAPAGLLERGLEVRLRGLQSIIVSTAVYLQDTFQGTAGTQLQSHTSDTGSSWATPTGGNIELDGNGKVYLESTGDSYSLSNATMPTALPFEVHRLA